MSDMHRDIAVAASDHCYEIRKLHQRSSYGGRCRECNRIYPCPTVQILDRSLTDPTDAYYLDGDPFADYEDDYYRD